MIDKQTIDDVHILYICSYGQTGLPICVDLEHRHCKLKSQKSKKCNLRPVVSYKDYKRKEEECDELKEESFTFEQLIKEYEKYGAIEEIVQQLNQLKAEKEKMSKGYTELTEIVSPYIDDFAVYNEKLGGFDIVLCIKKLLQQFKHLQTENEELKKKCNIYTCGICGNKEDCNKLYKTLTEIKKIAEVEIECKTYEIKNDCFNETRWKALNEHIDFTKQILQKISECEVNNAK